MARFTSDEIKEMVGKGEGPQLEMKKCMDKLPKDLWETYSAFANTRGGQIILGVTEHKGKPLSERFEITGVADAYKIIEDFFNIVNNRQKVSRRVTVDNDVYPVEVDGVTIVYIRVPEADYRQKPVYINDDLPYGTYKRLHDGDRQVTREELGMMLRDSSDQADGKILNKYGMEYIDQETLQGYRNAFRVCNPDHIYEKLTDMEFLMNMGCYAVDTENGIEGLTMAGLLMFGKSIPIHRVFPNFRFDYLDLIGIEPGSSKKWNDRLTDDGRWVDNIYNFLSIGLNKLLFTLPSEGRLRGVVRIDGGDLYEGVREAFINALTYCDYRLGGVLRIDRRSDRIIMRNPGSLRIAPERIYEGDYTQARNATIQKLLRMVGFGDNIGSGFLKIIAAWRSLGYKRPDIHEENDVNEVWLTLPLVKEEMVSTMEESEYQNGYVVKEDDEEYLSGMVIRDKLTPLQKTIIDTMKKTPSITIEEIAGIVGKDRNAVNYQLRKMRKLIYIERVGSDKTGHWKVHI